MPRSGPGRRRPPPGEASVAAGAGTGGRCWSGAWGWGALALLVGCSNPGDDPGPALPVEPAAIYAQMCARCHGVDGRGDPEIKKTLPVRDFSDPKFQAASYDAIAQVVMTGKNQMPAFGGLLSVPKIQSISGYVKRIGKAPAAPGPAPAPSAPGR
jgi:mono/diheme cytochrome c family protein